MYLEQFEKVRASLCVKKMYCNDKENLSDSYFGDS